MKYASTTMALVLALSSIPALAQKTDDSASFVSGEVQVTTLDNGKILVGLDEHPADGSADRVFVLQQDTPYETVDQWFADATLRVRDDQLAVFSRQEGWAMLLVLSGNIPRKISGVSGVRIIEGFGLSESWGDFGVPVDVAASEWHFRSTLPLKPGPAEGLDFYDTCDSGGSGATSCSVTACEGAPSGCSISCSSPKYACCWCKSHPAKAQCECRNPPSD